MSRGDCVIEVGAGVVDRETEWGNFKGRARQVNEAERPGRGGDDERREVLLVGRAPTLMWAMPYLMSRCGFHVDVITTSQLLRASRFVRELMLVGETDAITPTAYAHICDREKPYDWVIACEDQSLLELSGMDWPEDREPAYLPLQRRGERGHIYSKIGLSRMLEAGGVRTPPFRVAGSVAEALEGARELGYPVYVKEDAGSGGAGVYQCETDADLCGLEGLFAAGPLLVQKKIAGREVALSALFFEGRLAHFSYGVVERATAAQAISAVRLHLPLSLVDARVYEELCDLGRALEANGVVSITALEAADGSGLNYFEADMRPTVWVDAARLYGDDVAPRIRGWFERGEILSREDLAMAGGCEPMRVTHFQRLKLWEVLVNRFGVWRTIPWAERRMVLHLMGARMWAPASRKVVPKRVRQAVKRGMTAARIAFP